MSPKTSKPYITRIKDFINKECKVEERSFVFLSKLRKRYNDNLMHIGLHYDILTVKEFSLYLIEACKELQLDPFIYRHRNGNILRGFTFKDFPMKYKRIYNRNIRHNNNKKKAPRRFMDENSRRSQRNRLKRQLKEMYIDTTTSDDILIWNAFNASNGITYIWKSHNELDFDESISRSYDRLKAFRESRNKFLT